MNKRFVSSLVILVFLLPNLFSIFNLNPPMLSRNSGKNLYLSDANEKINTIFILPPEYSFLIYPLNNSLTIQLIDEFDNPLNSKEIELYIKSQGDWVFVTSDLTNESGLVNFKICHKCYSSNLYEYTVKFEGDELFNGLEANSTFIFIEDPAIFPPMCLGAKPYITYGILRSNDAGLAVIMHAWTTWDWEQLPVLPICYPKQDAIGEIRIKIYISESPNYYYEIYEDWAPFGNTQLKDITIPLNISSFTYSGTGSYGLYLFRGRHLSIYAKVVDDDNWDWDPFDGSSEFEERTWSNVATITDDDSRPPDSSPLIGSYGDILINDPRNYRINVTASDFSGWTGEIQYKFENSTYTSSIYQGSFGSTASHIRTTLTYYIPRFTWVNFPNCEIKIKYRLIDLDNDGGADQSSTAWSGWITVGTIWQDPGISVRIKPEAGTVFDNPYTNERFDIIITIANPTPFLLWADGFTVLSNDSRISNKISTISQGINNTVRNFVFAHPDYEIEYSEIISNRVTIQLTLQLNCTYKSISISYTQVKDVTIQKPPLPLATCVGFEGYQDFSDVFSYKNTTNSQPNVIKANIEIKNEARIKIKTSISIKDIFSYFDWDFTKLQITQSSVSNIEISPFESKIVQFVFQVTDTSVIPPSQFWVYGADEITDYVGLIIEEFWKSSPWVAIFEFIKDGIFWLVNYLGWDAMRLYSFKASFDTLFYYINTYEEIIPSVDYQNIEIKVPNQGNLTLVPSVRQFNSAYEMLSNEVLGDIATMLGSILLLGDSYEKIGGGLLLLLEVGYETVEMQDYYDANWYDPPDANFNEIVLPKYFNLTIPKNASIPFNDIVSDLFAAGIRFVGDSDAYYTSINRRTAALMEGDLAAVILQNRAIYNYSSMLSQDLRDLDAARLRLVYEIDVYNQTEKIFTIENLERVQQTINETGLPEEELEWIQFFNLTDSQIQGMVNSLTKLNISRAMKDLTPILAKAHNNTENLDEYYRSTGSIALENSIEISITVFNESIEEIPEDQMNDLNTLRYIINMEKERLEWNEVLQRSLELKQFAEKILLETNNLTITEYIRYANEMINIAYFSRAIDLIINPNIFTVDIGETKVVDILILNEISRTDWYNISINGLDENWFTLSENIINITANQFLRNASLIIHPPKNCLIAPKVYKFNVAVTALSNSSISCIKDIFLEILPHQEVEVSLIPKTIICNSGQNLTFTANIHNLGNVNDSYRVSFNPLDFDRKYAAFPTKIPVFWVTLDTIALNLTPCQDQNLSIVIQIPYNWTGMEDTIYEFEVIAVSQMDSENRNSSRASITILSKPINKMFYILSELSSLQLEINETVSGVVQRLINFQLGKTIRYINDSFYFYRNNSIFRSVILEKLAKIHLAVSEIFVIIGDFINTIEENCSKMLIERLHSIRNDITLTMGDIVGTWLSRRISQIELEILQFSDEIYNTTGFLKASLITFNLYHASEFLDNALIFFACQKNESALAQLDKSMDFLQKAKQTLSLLVGLGLIPEEIAAYYVTQIDNFILELELLCNE